ncbi:Franean1_4349 family RiPP [Candidatus Poribacteria bacterium]|nr:Franean1_4349 family RiPP [Candidatus Poribacteria bacterium]
MSQQVVETIIGKAVTDATFRKQLFEDPDSVLKGYDLTGEEIAALKAIEKEAIAKFAGELDERVSKSAGAFPI